LYTSIFIQFSARVYVPARYTAKGHSVCLSVRLSVTLVIHA